MSCPKGFEVGCAEPDKVYDNWIVRRLASMSSTTGVLPSRGFRGETPVSETADCTASNVNISPTGAASDCLPSAAAPLSRIGKCVILDFHEKVTCRQNSLQKLSPPLSTASKHRRHILTPRLPNSGPCCPVAQLRPSPRQKLPQGSTRFLLQECERWPSDRKPDGPRSKAKLSLQRQSPRPYSRSPNEN